MVVAGVAAIVLQPWQWRSEFDIMDARSERNRHDLSSASQQL
jgi:hypothetical protein